LEVDALKSEAKCTIKDLAEEQSELLHCKKGTDRGSPEWHPEDNKRIKTEKKAYIEAVQKSSGECVTLKKIKSAVKDIVEDRSRNVMILGLERVTGEYLRVKVTEVFEVGTDEKPFLKSERVENKVTDRPV
jgi:hypothetical protein